MDDKPLEVVTGDFAQSPTKPAKGPVTVLIPLSPNDLQQSSTEPVKGPVTVSSVLKNILLVTMMSVGLAMGIGAIIIGLFYYDLYILIIQGKIAGLDGLGFIVLLFGPVVGAIKGLYLAPFIFVVLLIRQLIKYGLS